MPLLFRNVGEIWETADLRDFEPPELDVLFGVRTNIRDDAVMDVPFGQDETKRKLVDSIRARMANSEIFNKVRSSTCPACAWFSSFVLFLQ